MQIGDKVMFGIPGTPGVVPGWIVDIDYPTDADDVAIVMGPDGAHYVRRVAQLAVPAARKAKTYRIIR